MDVSNIGDRLREARLEKRLTQENLADLCETAQGGIRHYEKSRRIPSIEMLVRLCNALKATPDYLLQDELSFNPYEEKSEIFSTIDKLTPKQLDFLKEFLILLQKQ